MKKILSVVLSLALIIGMLVMPINVNAYSVKDLDNTGELAALFTFEDDGYKVRFSSSLSVWQKDPTHALSYYNGSWGSGNITSNPVQTNTGAAESIINNSDKAWNYYKGSADHWYTGGGSVLHVYTENGPEPIILENNVTYKISFDYMVYSTRRLDEFVNGNTVGKIGADAEEVATVGYGYKTGSSTGLHPFNTPSTTVGTFVKYSEKNNELGTYTGDNSKTRQVGSWYHVEYTFTPSGMAELDLSNEGTIEAPQKAPFLVFYMKEYSGTSIFIDNVKLQSQIVGTINPMGGTTSDTTFKGFVGEQENITPPTRFGYDFAGWYTDGALKNKFDGVFTADLHGGYLYAGWDNSKIGFESFAKMPTDMSSNLSSSTDRAYSGKKSLIYSYSKNSLENWYNTRTTASNMFSIKPIDADGMYKLSFKYYMDGNTNVKVYPVTSGSTSSTAYKAYTDNSLTLSSADKGQWKTGVIYFTTSCASGGMNVGLHVEAASNAAAKVYFDDVTVTASRGGSTLTVNAGEGTIDSVKSATINVDYGQELIFDNLYYKDHFVEGFYYDASFTRPVSGKAFLEDMAQKTVYVKWSSTESLEFYKYKNNKALLNGVAVTNDYAKSGNTALAVNISDDNKGKTLFAAVGDIENGKSYVLEFYYYSADSTEVEIKPIAVNKTNLSVKSYEGFTLKNGSSEWKKAAVMFTAESSDAVLALGVVSQSGNKAKIYFDDLTLTALSATENCVIFDTMSVDGQRIASIGTNGQQIAFAETPNAVGKTFEGWYSDALLSTAYTATTYSKNLAVYAKMNDSAVSQIQGDVDGDGSVNAADLARLKRYLAGHDIQITLNADIDANGKVNAIDLVKLYKKLVG